MSQDQTTKPSIRAMIAALEVGETFSHAQQFAPTDLHLLNETKSTLRQNFSPAVKRAKDATGYEYTMETTETLTSMGNIYVVVLITRTN